MKAAEMMHCPDITLTDTPIILTQDAMTDPEDIRIPGKAGLLLPCLFVSFHITLSCTSFQ